MSLETDIIGLDDDETNELDRFLQIPKKKSARRSLESQFQTCVHDDRQENAEATNSTDESSKSNSSNVCDVLSPKSKPKNIAPMHTLSVSGNIFTNTQIYAASSTESIASSASSRRRGRSPVRTPSFCAAVSSSLISIDKELKRETEKTQTNSSALKKKSKNSSTKRSITSLPHSPHVPNQTSTPAPNQITTISSSHVNTIDSDTALCRICHDGDNCEALVSPCYCTGSVGALHMTCLERWLGASNTTRCEICKYEFMVERKPRPFVEFLRHPTSQADRKNMVCDLVCFIVLTPLTVCSAFLCLMGVKHYDKWSGRWEVIGLSSLTACLLTIFLIWCSVAMKHHVDVFKDWRQKNQVIKIIYLSPTKGRTVLRTQTVKDTTKDTNNNNVTQCHALGCQTQATPAAFLPLCRTSQSQDRGNRSYNSAMLKPILKYSVNLQSYSNPSALESPGSLSHSITWGHDTSDCGSYPLLCSHGNYKVPNIVGKETCV